MKLLSKAGAFSLAFLLAFSAPVSVRAESSSSIKSELEKATEKRDELARQVASVGSQLQDTEVMLDQTKDQIVEVESQIQQKQEELQQKQSVLAERTSANYKAGPTSIIEIILESTSFDELCSNIYYANKVNQADEAAIYDVTNARNDLEQQKNSLSSLKTQQEQLRDNQKSQSESLKSEQQKQEDYINSLNADLKAQMKKEDDERIAKEKAAAEAAAAAAAAAAASQNNSGSSTSGGGGYKPSGTGSRTDLINAGYSQLGVPYVFGAYSPGVALDCSGFTKYCYSQIGINLPHSAAAQAAMASSKSLSELQPGDLIFWIGTSPGSLSGSHVAMYIGNNQVIHADGTRVSVGPIWSGWSKAGSIL